MRSGSMPIGFGCEDGRRINARALGLEPVKVTELLQVFTQGNSLFGHQV